MATCKHCGHYKPLNPLAPLTVGLSQFVALWLMNHWRSDGAAFMGIPDYFGTALWFYWWIMAVGGTILFAVGIFGCVYWLLDPAGFYRGDSSSPKG